MKKSLLGILVLCAAVGLLAANALCWHLEGDGVQIAVSPHTLVLSSPDTAISVHTNLLLEEVDVKSLALNGVEPTFTKADSRGNLVAKFAAADIKAIVAPPKATLTLTGAMCDGTPFAGSDTITVRK